MWDVIIIDAPFYVEYNHPYFMWDVIIHTPFFVEYNHHPYFVLCGMQLSSIPCLCGV